MIEVDHALDLFEFVRCYGELGLQEGLLGGEDLQIVRKTMLHQKLRVPYCGLQVDHLLLVNLETLLCRLPLDQGVVDLYSGIEKALLELVECSLLLCLCFLEVCLEGPLVEDRLHEGCTEIGNESARIHARSRCGPS